MPESSQADFRTTELDADLLATPFRVQTNWHVITGTPSCGKTTLINLLAGQDYPTGSKMGRRRARKTLKRASLGSPMTENPRPSAFFRVLFLKCQMARARIDVKIGGAHQPPNPNRSQPADVQLRLSSNRIIIEK
jgi:energy-coupling factor transporter ATP-binding protein EcfA2